MAEPDVSLPTTAAKKNAQAESIKNEFGISGLLVGDDCRLNAVCVERFEQIDDAGERFGCQREACFVVAQELFAKRSKFWVVWSFAERCLDERRGATSGKRTKLIKRQRRQGTICAQFVCGSSKIGGGVYKRAVKVEKNIFNHVASARQT